MRFTTGATPRPKSPRTSTSAPNACSCAATPTSRFCYHEGGNRRAYIPQTDTWREAYELTEQMPNLNIRRCFASIIYYVLSGAYNQSYRYDEQVALTNDQIALLDRYYSADSTLGRRPYLYKDNSYVRPYQQLMQCALNIRRNDYAARYFNEFRSRMLAAEGENLLRNKSYLYEMGYLLESQHRCLCRKHPVFRFADPPDREWQGLFQHAAQQGLPGLP